MQNDYAQAVVTELEQGTPADTVLAGLTAALARKHHTKLLPSILRIVERTLMAKKSATTPRVRIATKDVSEADQAKITAALTALGVTPGTAHEEIIDETLIGGFIASYNYQEHDHSYKRVLTNLFESITA